MSAAACSRESSHPTVAPLCLCSISTYDRRFTGDCEREISIPMAIPVARVHLKVAHAALPALLPTPPKWKMLPLLSTPPCVAAAVLPKPLAKKPSRADADERWDAHKAKPASPASSASPSSGPRSAADSTVRSSGPGLASFPRKNATSPPPKPGRADSVERWDAHKKTASATSSSSSSGASSLKWPISRATSAERWDVHKKRRPPQPQAEPLDDDESSSTGSNDIDDTEEEEEEILWKPRAMYAGPGFVTAAPEPSMLPMPLPTTFLAVRVG